MMMMLLDSHSLKREKELLRGSRRYSSDGFLSKERHSTAERKTFLAHIVDGKRNSGAKDRLN